MVWILFSHTVSTQELDESLHEANAIPSTGFLHSVSTVSDNSRLQVAPSIKYHKLWSQARALLLAVLQAGKKSSSKPIHYFSGHPATFGFLTSLLPGNITLSPANKGVDQSPSDFKTGIGTAANATLDTEQLISHTRTAYVCNLKKI